VSPVRYELGFYSYVSSCLFLLPRTWEEYSKCLRHFLAECTLVPSTQQCLKNKTIAALDQILLADVIPLFGGVELVRYVTLQPPGNGSSTHSR
jgi:hypothetical protein